MLGLHSRWLIKNGKTREMRRTYLGMKLIVGILGEG
jgi:hypothetical protein